MREQAGQLMGKLGRADIVITAIFFVLYGVWIAWQPYGCLPFFGFALIIAYNVSKSHKGLRRLTDQVRKEHPQQLSDQYWSLLRQYGVAIYSPNAAAPLALALKRCEIMGYIACIVLLLMQRWIDVLAAFSGSMLALHMVNLLAPEQYFDKLARKKPEQYAPMADGIRALKAWVQSDEAP
jgi:hypothetical protein